MNYGLTPAQYSLLEKLMITPLKSCGADVWIFGSRAKENFRKYSDIDILFALPTENQLSMGFLSTIKEDLEESSLPFKVDLVNWKEVAESYRQDILKNRIKL